MNVPTNTYISLPISTLPVNDLYRLELERAMMARDLHMANQAFQSLLLLFEDLRTKYDRLVLYLDNVEREKKAFQHVCARDAERFQVASTQLFEIGFVDGDKCGRKQALVEIEELKQKMAAMMKKNQQLEINQRDFDITNANAKDLRKRCGRYLIANVVKH